MCLLINMCNLCTGCHGWRERTLFVCWHHQDVHWWNVSVRIRAEIKQALLQSDDCSTQYNLMCNIWEPYFRYTVLLIPSELHTSLVFGPKIWMYEATKFLPPVAVSYAKLLRPGNKAICTHNVCSSKKFYTVFLPLCSKTINKGVGVESIHFLGDGLWEMKDASRRWYHLDFCVVCVCT